MDYPLLNFLFGSIGVLVTATFYRRVISSKAVGIMFGAQMVVSLISLILAFGLYRSLVPIPVA